jgi:hypothetical protein
MRIPTDLSVGPGGDFERRFFRQPNKSGPRMKVLRVRMTILRLRTEILQLQVASLHLRVESLRVQVQVLQLCTEVSRRCAPSVRLHGDITR